MRVAGDLLVGYKPKKERDIDDEDSQFQQFYTGKVIITGSLTVDNVGRDNPFATAVFVNGLPFTESMLRDVYLLQNTPQVNRELERKRNTEREERIRKGGKKR